MHKLTDLEGAIGRSPATGRKSHAEQSIPLVMVGVKCRNDNNFKAPMGFDCLRGQPPTSRPSVSWPTLTARGLVEFVRKPKPGRYVLKTKAAGR